jgi:hypothetical protein
MAASFASNSRNMLKKFPYKLHHLLDQAERVGFEDIVSWIPSGKGFRIHRHSAFEERIMPVHFPGMTSYKSFRRQLNLYGIRLIGQDSPPAGDGFPGKSVVNERRGK